ncbi:MPN207a family PTS transporter accessory protein [Mycoplasmoides alvi]|uniref:MPN207a family PTS transporter accessory protein n=1 Tax=Mycoplasmoides alvi TaxID=78580 RepID=UPI0038CBFE59
MIVSIFALIAIVSFSLSYYFYKFKKCSNNNDLKSFSSLDSDLNFEQNKWKSWWIKYRASGFFCLGILFSMLAIGGIIFNLNL